ncbi:hypothetical protein SDRG_12802 [Saprolegnia diclina VS20]|uniref:Small ribosomal subunit protein mS29 n=1 Tax=Saprolegnia diclina (strain VS20) TaxID=1156394 RepID=T0RBK4_SAPDV|nr:hypothetical protein SDRG_12802 [Saprolegnia diclina VS20]EQC29553.1 hypothetical protein SDRG_12802 [Saprolegnia diclina VS20]|eukprot:XP_008617105.1 hypothetical protein SDRG_12802 [Saprolegnia diclina VS20]
MLSTAAKLIPRASRLRFVQASRLAAFSTEAPVAAEATEAAPAGVKAISAAHPISQVEKEDLLKFFELSDAQIKNNFPEGMPKRIKEYFELTEPQKQFMLRKPTLDILSVMKDFPNNWPAHWPEKAFVLDGERGTGKSVALLQIVNFARENGWIVLFAPHVRAWCYDAPYVTKSAHIQGKYDIDVVAMDVLKQLIQSHGHQLAELSLSADYGDKYYPHTFEKKPKSTSEYDKASLTLLDMAENGLKDDLLSCAALVDLRAELAKVTKFPVLIAIDEYNTLFEKTVFGYEGHNVAPRDISFIHALADVDETGHREDRSLANGLFVAATTKNFPSAFKFTHQVDCKRLRKVMHPYSHEELDQLIAYLRSINFWKKDLTPTEVSFLRLMTKNVPVKVFKQACIM